MIILDNSLIYVATPKTATTSVRRALIESGIPYTEFHPTGTENMHYHVPLSQMIDKWGVKESFCIEREWFERWVSGINYVFVSYLRNPELQCKFTPEDISNEFIYSSFTDKFINDIYSSEEDIFRKCQKKFISNPEELKHPSRIKVLCSSSYWKSGKKCTYEFGMNQITELESFIHNKFGVKVNIPKLNVTEQSIEFPNLIINEELKDFAYNRFEKKYTKKLL